MGDRRVGAAATTTADGQRAFTSLTMASASGWSMRTSATPKVSPESKATASSAGESTMVTPQRARSSARASTGRLIRSGSTTSTPSSVLGGGVAFGRKSSFAISRRLELGTPGWDEAGAEL